MFSRLVFELSHNSYSDTLTYPIPDYIHTLINALVDLLANTCVEKVCHCIAHLLCMVGDPVIISLSFHMDVAIKVQIFQITMHNLLHYILTGF